MGEKFWRYADFKSAGLIKSRMTLKRAIDSGGRRAGRLDHPQLPDSGPMRRKRRSSTPANANQKRSAARQARKRWINRKARSRWRAASGPWVCFAQRRATRHIKSLSRERGRMVENRARKPRNKIAENWISYSRSMLESLWPSKRYLTPRYASCTASRSSTWRTAGPRMAGSLLPMISLRHTASTAMQWAPQSASWSRSAFLEITEKGCAGNESYRRANRFRVTYVNMKNRQQPTNEWRKIETKRKPRDWPRPREPTRIIAQRSVGRGEQPPEPKTISQCRRPPLIQCRRPPLMTQFPSVGYRHY